VKILFLSNFYNHHQAYVSRELYKQTNGQYRFVATEKMPDERKKLGYLSIQDEFVVQYGESDERDLQIQQWIDEADAIIIGSAPEYLIENRKKMRKAILRYSERPLKNGFQWWKYPLRYFSWHLKNPYKSPIYMLCASAYTASDYAMYGLFKNKTFKWGYFPRCVHYEDVEQMILKKNPTEILWCGRFLNWKHPDDAIVIASNLKKEGYQFHLTIIGTGDMETQLKNMVLSYDLKDEITFTGAVSSEEVRSYMEYAGIYLMTSDRKEGWGAVLNEAMNSACAVIASSSAGAVPYLVKDGVNGMVYDDNCIDELYTKIKFLLDHPDKQRQLGLHAYRSIVEIWNPEVAATRLVRLIEQLSNEQKFFFDEGPCSKA
jgi:glycosyltransferase involved in cell wall biosynthesis